eukprot:m.58035 g.58035  ORF g.58035 m.58035 type:complete len:160 (+) comp34781_c0_seq1:714-1193(+)
MTTNGYTEWEFCNGETRKVEDVSDPVNGRKLDLTFLPISSADLSTVFSRSTKALTALNLGDCGLSSIPDSIQQLVNLYRLRVQSNDLPFLPASIGQLKQLTVLCAYGNRLSALPPQFRSLSKLKTLRLGGNHFTDGGLEAVESGMSSLQELSHFAEDFA